MSQHQPPKQMRTLTIALLVADTPPAPVVTKRGDYTRIYPEWLHKSKAAIARHDWQDEYKLDIVPYDVVQAQKYPDEGMLHDGLIDAIMITGSASSAHLDQGWTNKLADYIKHVYDAHPLVRIMGVCYGHQIIARALGGETQLNPRGWELGVYDCELTQEGSELLNYDDGEDVNDAPKQMRIQQVHRDAVTELPPDCVNLATTERTPCQGLAQLYPTPAPPLPSVAGTSAYMAFDINDFGTDSSGPMPVRSAHVLSVQGHPEFNEEIVRTLIDARSEMGTIDGALRDEGLARVAKPHDGIHLGAVFLAMLGLEPRKTDQDVV